MLRGALEENTARPSNWRPGRALRKSGRRDSNPRPP